MSIDAACTTNNSNTETAETDSCNTDTCGLTSKEKFFTYTVSQLWECLNIAIETGTICGVVKLYIRKQLYASFNKFY